MTAVILAPKRKINANGFINIPAISIGIKIIKTGAGTPPGIIFFQCPINPCFIVPAIIIEKNVITDNAAVTVKLPVIVELPETGANLFEVPS